MYLYSDWGIYTVTGETEQNKWLLLSPLCKLNGLLCIPGLISDLKDFDLSFVLQSFQIPQQMFHLSHTVPGVRQAQQGLRQAVQRYFHLMQ